MLALPINQLKRRHPWPNIRPAAKPTDHGWYHHSVDELFRKILNEKTNLVVELGSWCGLSTRRICDLAPGATVIAIDHWLGSPEINRKAECKAMLPTLYETFLVSCWGYRNQIIPIRKNSIDGMVEVFSLNLRPDMVYVDADHSYESVKKDIQTVRRLWPGCPMVGDDWGLPSVQKAVNEFVKEYGQLDEVLYPVELSVSGSGWCLW